MEGKHLEGGRRKWENNITMDTGNRLWGMKVA
jgi:hypothetical protein